MIGNDGNEVQPSVKLSINLVPETSVSGKQGQIVRYLSWSMCSVASM